MSLGLGSVADDRLFVAADSKVRILARDGVKAGIGSKIAVYRSDRATVVIGHAGMWITDVADEGLHSELRAWFARREGEDALCARLAELSQELTANSAREGHLNLTEFLVGVVHPSSTTSLWYVSSQAFQPVPSGIVRAIGGDNQAPFTQWHRPSQGVAVDAAFMLDAFARDVARVPSDAYDYPLQLVVAARGAPGTIERRWFDRDGITVPAPPLDWHVPAPFVDAEAEH